MVLTSWYGASWYGSEWYAGAQVVLIDTHDDGERKRKHYAKQKKARERLREQIGRAIDGEPVLAIALELVAAPGSAPLEERVDISELVAQAELWRAVREAATAYAVRQRALDDEDDFEAILVLL